ncbi:Dimodular nonribosomal peptide synthase [compost metagenome]
MENTTAWRIATRFAGLAPEQRREFLKRMAEQGVSFGQLPIPPSADAEQGQALSYAQQRQWFLWQLDPQGAAYNIPAALRLTGKLDVAALQRSFDALVARHQTLRTRFVEQDGQVLQQVEPAFGLPLERSDLRDTPQGQRLDAALRQVEAEIQRPFDLAAGPLLRVKLLQLADDDQVLVLCLHHIVADGWSMGVLVEEFSQLYAAYSQGREVELPALPIQYADYALWQRRWMEAGELERQLEWWKAQLGDEQSLLELPTDRPRPAQPSQRGARLDFALDAATAAGLKALARQRGVTLFMLLLASFQTLLHRYSGQRDFCVGVPVGNRNRAETRGLIGFFVNTQVLRAELDGRLPFGQLLERTRDKVLGAQDHQELPFERLVQALQGERSLSHSPLFQVMVNHQQSRPGALDGALPGLQVEGLDWSGRTTQFDLQLDTFEEGERLLASLTWATDLFDAARIEALAQHWRNLLGGLLANPDAPIAELPLLEAAERAATLEGLNATATEYPGPVCVQQHIEARVAENGAATALVFNGQRLSYAELNQRANRLARHLRKQGVGAESLVGVACERSLEMVVALLAILKAGGAYVPLDPEYPADRLAYMIEDSGITLLLTQSHLKDGLPMRGGVEALCLDQLDLAGYSAENPDNRSAADNLAYVIYTSGSTGRPKGALLSHANVTRLLGATAEDFRFGADDVWTLFHSYAFDFSVWELFGALCTGGRLVVVPYFVSRSPEAFHQLLADERVTVLNQTPTAFRQLLPLAVTSERELALRVVIFGGEALELASLKPWFERFGDRQPTLVNMYGITETTVHVTYRPISLADLEGPAQSPIGRPIHDLAWYLLDANLQPVPVGVTGELYVAGAGLARGYHGRAGLSAERFVPSPFASGERLYRSGDLARQRADGGIDYLGRKDQQVKIRGFRIELGEIEARLLEQAGVRQAALAVQQGAAGAQLCAYVVPEQQPADPLAWREALRNALKAGLPDYMVPAHLLLLDQLPLTGNGKLDRKALPAPDADAWQRPYEAPQGELEGRIAAIWAEVLEVERVGRGDNFFDLGGHSLLAAQASARVELELGIELPLRALFESADLQAYAAQAGAQAPADNDARLDALESLLDEMETL